jgi:hypothetical protein
VAAAGRQAGTQCGISERDGIARRDAPDLRRVVVCGF